jgi:hypothetical protein
MSFPASVRELGQSPWVIVMMLGEPYGSRIDRHLQWGSARHVNSQNIKKKMLEHLQEYPKQSPNPGILGRLKKSISNNFQTHLPIFWHLKKITATHIKLGARIVVPIWRWKDMWKKKGSTEFLMQLYKRKIKYKSS